MFRDITAARRIAPSSSFQNRHPSEIVLPKIILYSSQFRRGVQMLDLVVEMAGERKRRAVGMLRGRLLLLLLVRKTRILLRILFLLLLRQASLFALVMEGSQNVIHRVVVQVFLGFFLCRSRRLCWRRLVGGG